MNCEHAKLHIGAAPDETSAELEGHLRSCPACSAFRAEARAFDARLRQAMQSPPPGLMVASEFTARRRRKPHNTRRIWALAASFLLAAIAILVLWPAETSPALAAALIEHVGAGEERASWNNTAIVPEGLLDRVLRASGVRLKLDDSAIVYAHSCRFRGRQVPHLVLRGPQGPLTVIPLVGETIATGQQFSGSGLRGVLLPQPGGAVAVLARDEGTPVSLSDSALDRLARAIAARIELGPQSAAR